MKQVLFLISLLLILFSSAPAQPAFQLAPPLVKYPTVFFTKTTAVELLFAQNGTEIRYTLNGREPDSLSAIYRQPVILSKKMQTLKARSMGAGFLPSETITTHFIRNGKKIDSIAATPAHASYPAGGVQSLNDNLGGNPSPGSGAWLGYLTDTVEIQAFFTQKQRCSQLLLHFLRNTGSWIFLPQKITVEYFDEGRRAFMPFGEALLKAAGKEDEAACIPHSVYAQRKIITNRIRIRIQTVQSLPEWHPGKNNHAWCFIDEIKIY